VTRFYCFSTVNTPYEAVALKCAASFGKHGVIVSLRSMPVVGGWMRNCMARAEALRSHWMGECPDDAVCLLDADLECLGDPVALLDFPGDVAVHDSGPDVPNESRYSAGVLAFAPTPEGKCILSRWVDLCAGDKHFGKALREQLYLREAIQEREAQGARVFRLPRTYNMHIDHHKDGDGTVILHHVVSRTLRKVMGGSL